MYFHILQLIKRQSETVLFFSGTCWSSYHKGLLASSDYEGTVTLWDAFTGVKNRSFQVCLGYFVYWCGVA